jgi:cytochrome c
MKRKELDDMKLLPVIAAAVALAVSMGAMAAPDADAAMAQMKESGCTKCHAADKTKKGPSFKKTAEKYKGKADAYEKLHKWVTEPHKAKMEDGTEEDHKVLKTKDEKAIKNVVDFILSN